jgi:peptidoglycan/LPS O-acetylase OafA/YrhL
VLNTVDSLIVTSGYSGVDVFLLLSGMGLVFALDKNSSIKRFYYRRARRLFLPYLVVSILIALANEWSLIYYLKAVSGYSFLFEDVHALLWYVHTILIFYLFFPLYYYVVKSSKHKDVVVAIAFLLSVIFPTVLTFFDLKIVGLSYLSNRIPIFITGTAIAFARNRPEQRIKKGHIIVCSIIFCFWLLLMYSTLPNINPIVPLNYIPDYVLLAYLVAVSLTILVSYLFGRISKDSFLRKVLRKIGVISFELYCVQESLTIFVSKLIGEHIHISNAFAIKVIRNIACLVSCFVVAYLLHLMNEKIMQVVDKRVLYNHNKQKNGGG